VLDVIWEAFDVRPPTDGEWGRVMDADDRLLAYEADSILEGGEWAGETPDLGYDLRAESISAVREQFRSRCETLLDAV